MVGWHHRLNGHEFEQTLGDREGQGSLACCRPWSCRVRHDLATEQQQLQQQQQQQQQQQHTFQNDHRYKSSYHYDCMVTVMIQRYCILVDCIPPHCAFRTCDLFIL